MFMLLSTHCQSDCEGMLTLMTERSYTHSHIQAFITFFFQQTPWKKTVCVAAKHGTKKHKPGKTTMATKEVIIQCGDVLDQVEEREQEMLDGPSVENDKGEAGEGADDVDEAWAAHDDTSVRTVHAQAIKEAEELGIAMSQKEKYIALGLFPKVCQCVRI